ncbi:MmgE/PrpD family protein [Paracoccus onubensis]|uniref:MmgE/PrpD family protein n=1 Tax=Paracoccus onubensis TaxID=1675788 RepID=A0A418T8H7_9RHOB|nr:MmgE/PrpD family protein [Paracoccus onubensis]RJE89453.1 MmgE/PrpD family protein [Paracoccus onubensis]
MTLAFADFLHDTHAEDLPDEVLMLARHALLDLIGVAAAGSQTALSRIIRDHAAEHFAPGRKSAIMLLDGRRVSPAGAALAGGMTIDAMDAHDGHKLTKGHVGCGLFPALLAIAQAEAVTDDRAFLTALVLGYEIGTRAGIALHRSACDYHSSGAWVAIACAAIGARLLGLDSRRTREAIGIAEYHGPRSQMMRCIDHPTMVKDGSGWGAMTGVSAAYLAADGFTGAPALTVEADDLSDLWSALGSNWRIREQYFKHWPICRWAQPAVQAALMLRDTYALRSEQIRRIQITTFHQSLRLACREPATTEQAQYSTAFPTAVALVHGRIEPGDVDGQDRMNPEIRRLASNMVIRESPEFNAAFPARRFADLRLELADGRVVRSGPTEAPGDPDAPVTCTTVRDKFQRYATPVLGAATSAELEDAVSRLGSGAGTGRFFGLLGGSVALRG